MMRALPLMALFACSRFADTDPRPDDTSAPRDTGRDDTGPADTGPGDSADTGADTAPDDTAPDETGNGDSGQDTGDTGQGDSGHGDTGPWRFDPAASGLLYGAVDGLALGGRGTLAAGGDLDGDGVDDLIVLAPTTGGGAAWLVPGDAAVGASGPVGSYARAKLVGSAIYTLTGVQGPMADLTGDGTTDLLLGASSAYDGAVLLLDGDAATGEVPLPSAYTARFVGDSTGDAARSAATGDLDGDGEAEVVIGAVFDNWTSGWSTAFYVGSIAVFRGGGGGGFVGDHDLADADDRVYGAASYDYLGATLVVGDVTGDGYADLVTGAPGHDGGASNGGAVHVLPGGGALAWADRADDAAAFTVVGTTRSTALGGEPLPSPGDLDGDGLGDLALAAFGVGKVWAFVDLAGRSGELSVDEATVPFAGTAGAFATALAVGDLDGDDIADLVVGAAGDDTTGVDAGAVFLFAGGAAFDGSGSSDALGAEDAAAAVYGTTAGDGLGAGLAVGGDLDGDGALDLVAGAPGVDDGALEAGAVYVLRGR